MAIDRIRSVAILFIYRGAVTICNISVRPYKAKSNLKNPRNKIIDKIVHSVKLIMNMCS